MTQLMTTIYSNPQLIFALKIPSTQQYNYCKVDSPTSTEARTLYWRLDFSWLDIVMVNLVIGPKNDTPI